MEKDNEKMIDNTKVKRLFFDIETSPCLATVWRTGKTVINDTQILSPIKIICISYKWEGKDKVHNLKWDRDQCDKQMLSKFYDVLEEADEVVGHNIRSFDLKNIQGRFATHGLPPMPLFLIQDTYTAARATMTLASLKLNYLAKVFKIGQKVETGGYGLWLDCFYKNDRKALKQMVKYCEGDVTLTEKVYNKLKPYIKVQTNLAARSMDLTMCPSCGGKLIVHSAVWVTGITQRQRFKCKSCHRTCTSKKINGSTQEVPK